VTTVFGTSLRRALDRRVTIPSDGAGDLRDLVAHPLISIDREPWPNRAQDQLRVDGPTSGPRIVVHNKENF
jgi:hypothetical protein